MRLFDKDYRDENIIQDLKNEIVKILNKNTIIVCIGTDLSIGDSIAPFVGTLLQDNNFRLPVYGTINNPIHAQNINKKLNKIKYKHPNANIIGIDACLGNVENIGKIQIRDIPIHPGKGVGKSLPDVGEYSIVGIVDDYDKEVLFEQRSIRLRLIYNMAKIIATSIIKAENTYRNNIKEVAICE